MKNIFIFFILTLFTTSIFSDENIFKAIQNDDLINLKELISNKENLYIKTENLNNSLLHIAVEHDSIECIEYLLNNKLDINYKNKNGISPFIYALQKNNTALIKFLLFKAWPDVYNINLYNYYSKNDKKIDILKKYNYMYFANVKNTNGTDMYEKPSFKSKKKITIPFSIRLLVVSFYGKTFNYKDKTGRWIKAQYKNKTGYFFTGDLEPSTDKNCINVHLLNEFSEDWYKIESFNKNPYIVSFNGEIHPAIRFLNSDKYYSYQRLEINNIYDSYSYRILKILKIKGYGYKIYIENTNDNKGKSPYLLSLKFFSNGFYINDNKFSNLNGYYVNKNNSQKYEKIENEGYYDGYY